MKDLDNDSNMDMDLDVKNGVNMEVDVDVNVVNMELHVDVKGIKDVALDIGYEGGCSGIRCSCTHTCVGIICGSLRPFQAWGWSGVRFHLQPNHDPLPPLHTHTHTLMHHQPQTLIIAKPRLIIAS